MKSTIGRIGGAVDDRPIIVTGGQVHVRQAVADGANYQVQMQFFKTRHCGQCWNGLGRDRAGHIYLGNSTHTNNSFVYRLDPKTGQMRFLGDLLSNIRFGGRGGTDNGKIHSGFIEGPDGDMYFLSHCGSDGNIRYGGHLWKYDVQADRIVDLGVPMPGNTNFALSEPVNGITYTCSTPGGIFIRIDLNTLQFTALEKTDMNYVRHLPVDPEGNLYIFWQNQIRKFDPRVGHWQVVARNEQTDPDKTFGPTTGFAWSADRRRLYFTSHVQGNLFRWTVGSPTVEPLGKLHPDRHPVYLHGLHVDGAEGRLYSMGGTAKKDDKGFYVHDLARHKSHKLFSLDEIIDHELTGHADIKPFIDFTDCGGVTGDDGTMYFGFTGGDADQDSNPNGDSVVAITAVRVTCSESASPAAALRSSFSQSPGAPELSSSKRAEIRSPSSQADSASAVPSSGPTVSGTGIVASYRPAERPQDRNAEGQFPLAYWIELAADPADPTSKPALLFVHVGAIDNGPDRLMTGGKIIFLPDSLTAHQPRFDRYLLAGRRLRYTGRLTSPAGEPAYIDTAVPGGRVAIVFDAVPVSKLADFVIGTTVAFDGVIEPRKPWIDPFDGEDWGQDWQLLVTLPTGQVVDIGDRLLTQHFSFRRAVAMLRDQQPVRVRVIGQVWDAAPLKQKAADLYGDELPGTPHGIIGPILVAVEELQIQSV